MRSEEEVTNAIDKYADMVYRICMVRMKDASSTADIFQEVFFKYAMHDASFESAEHEKAWMIRVTMNCCRDFLKSFFRRHTVPIDPFVEMKGREDTATNAVLEALLQLPVKYRDPLYLCYYEGYTAKEAGEILHLNVNTVYTRLTRGKEALKKVLGEWYEE